MSGNFSRSITKHKSLKINIEVLDYNSGVFFGLLTFSSELDFRQFTIEFVYYTLEQYS